MVVVTDENKDLIPQERVENLESDFDAVNQTASNNFNTLDTKIDTNVNAINKTISDLESYMEEKLNNVFPLFYTTWSDHILNQSCWLRADTFSAHSGDTYSSAYNHLVNDLKTATKKTTVREWKSNNISIIGNNIINDHGKISGFYSNTNYVSHVAQVPTKSMDYVLKTRTPPSFANYTIFYSNLGYKGLVWRIASSGASTIWASSNGTSWNVASSFNPNLTIPTNSDVWFRIQWDGATYKFSISIDGSTWQTGTTIAHTVGLAFNGVHNIGGASWETAYPWYLGTVDLNNCYLDVDGKRIWSGCNYYSQLTYYDSTDGHKIVLNDQETILNDLYNRKGVAWYYVLNQTNKTFRLPRTKYGFVGVRDSGGTFVDESLPNIKGTITNHGTVDYTSSYGLHYTFKDKSALYADGQVGAGFSHASGYAQNLQNINIDASRVSDAYKDNASVQQKSTQMYLYFYIGHLDVEISEQIVNELLESINTKVDKTDLVETPAILVETYRNGDKWYRLWSDGWCEQGGTQTSITQDSTTSITLIKPYNNSSYNVITQTLASGSNNNGNNNSGEIYTKSSSSFIIYTYNYTKHVYWEAKGYIS